MGKQDLCRDLKNDIIKALKLFLKGHGLFCLLIRAQERGKALPCLQLQENRNAHWIPDPPSTFGLLSPPESLPRHIPGCGAPSLGPEQGCFKPSGLQHLTEKPQISTEPDVFKTPKLFLILLLV